MWTCQLVGFVVAHASDAFKMCFFFFSKDHFPHGAQPTGMRQSEAKPCFLGSSFYTLLADQVRSRPSLCVLQHCPAVLEREASPPPGPHYCCMPDPRKEVNSHFKSDFEGKRSAVFEEDTISGPPILHFKVNTAIL